MTKGPESSHPNGIVDELDQQRDCLIPLSEGTYLKKFPIIGGFTYEVFEGENFSGIMLNAYFTREENQEVFVAWKAPFDIRRFLNASNDYIRLHDESEDKLPPDEVAVFVAKNYLTGDDGIELRIEYPADVEDIYRKTENCFGEDLEDIDVIRVTHANTVLWGSNNRVQLISKYPYNDRQSRFTAVRSLFEATASHPELSPAFCRTLELVEQDMFAGKRIEKYNE